MKHNCPIYKGSNRCGNHSDTYLVSEDRKELMCTGLFMCCEEYQAYLQSCKKESQRSPKCIKVTHSDLEEMEAEDFKEGVIYRAH